MKLQDKCFAGAGIGMVYITGIVGGISEFNAPLLPGVIQCAVIMVLVCLLVHIGLGYEEKR